MSKRLNCSAEDALRNVTSSHEFKEAIDDITYMINNTAQRNGVKPGDLMKSFLNAVRDKVDKFEGGSGIL